MILGLLITQLSLAAEWQLQVSASSTLDEYYQGQTTVRKRIAVCDSVGEQLTACLWMRENVKDSFELVHLDQLSDHKLNREAAWQLGLDAMEKEVHSSRYQKIAIVGTPYNYWASNRYDGYDAAALLFPQKAAEIVNAPFLMAIPSRGTVLLWQEGSAEANKMIAVGVNDIYKANQLSVSPDIYKWDGERWRVWARGREQAK